MRSVLKTKYAMLGLRRLLRSIENQSVTCRKRKASTIQPFMSDLSVERHGYKQPFFNHTCVDNFITNFVGAEEELIACIENWNGMAPTIFAHKSVAWKFNSPAIPIMAAPGAPRPKREARALRYTRQ